MASPLAHLQPTLIWQHFDQIRQIPRPSKHEEAIRKHIENWAKQRNFVCLKDAVGNVCIQVPATPGHENAPTVILQGHMDIVPEKNSDFEFNFLTDPIECHVEGDWVIAEHTTLGADNGIGIAAALAAADDPDIVHGPLEILCTVDEETGLTGATELDPTLIKGKILLNLDSEEDGVLVVGCAGGCTIEATIELRRSALTDDIAVVQLDVTGLKGGHSGINIIENRANAIKVLCRVLQRWMDEASVCIKRIDGGNKHNAIPRQTRAIVAIPRTFLQRATEIAAQEKAANITEFQGIDPGLDIGVTSVSDSTSQLLFVDADQSQSIVRVLQAIPSGVATMSRDIPGLVETSSNLAIVTTSDKQLKITVSARSSVASALRSVLDEIRAAVTLANGHYEEQGQYPAWQPNMNSNVLRVCKNAYRKLYDEDPVVIVIHAGLECGIIGDKIGAGADMISMGPQLEGVHAPGEKIQISSVAKFWDLFGTVLKMLA